MGFFLAKSHYTSYGSVPKPAAAAARLYTAAEDGILGEGGGGAGGRPCRCTSSRRADCLTTECERIWEF